MDITFLSIKYKILWQYFINFCPDPKEKKESKPLPKTWKEARSKYMYFQDSE